MVRQTLQSVHMHLVLQVPLSIRVLHSKLRMMLLFTCLLRIDFKQLTSSRVSTTVLVMGIVNKEDCFVCFHTGIWYIAFIFIGEAIKLNICQFLLHSWTSEV